RHRDGAAGIQDLHPAHQPVGRVHRDAAHRVLAQMLSDFEHQIPRTIVDRGVRDPQCRENRWQSAVGKLDVNDVAQNLIDPPGTVCRIHNRYASDYAAAPLKASAPPTISINSLVICACRARFISSVSREIISAALLVAASIAVIFAPYSLASASSSACSIAASR